MFNTPICKAAIFSTRESLPTSQNIFIFMDFPASLVGRFSYYLIKGGVHVIFGSFISVISDVNGIFIDGCSRDSLSGPLFFLVRLISEICPHFGINLSSRMFCEFSAHYLVPFTRPRAGRGLMVYGTIGGILVYSCGVICGNGCNDACALVA